MKNFLSIGILLLFIFSGCKKDEPEPDPVKNITANYEITVKPTDWIYSSLYGQWYYNYYVTIPANSAIHGYVISGNGNQVLTYIDNFSSTIYTMADNSFQSPSHVQFQFVNMVTATNKPTTDEYFTLVVVPATARMSNNLDWSNYEEVKEFYNLD